MLPYGGTPIRDLLQREGRLRGDLTHPDYDFLDRRLNEYHRLLDQTVRPWIYNQGISNELNYAWDELETVRRLVPGIQGIGGYVASLQSLTKESNEQLFQLVQESSFAFERGDRSVLDPGAVRKYCEQIRTRLVSMRNNFVAENIYLLRDASQDGANRPVIAPQIH